jgi:hypothetical protein
MLRNAPTSGWRFFGQHIMGIEDPLRNAKISSKTLLATKQSSRDILGSAQRKVETCWPHFSPCPQMFSLAARRQKICEKSIHPIGNKESQATGPLAHHVSAFVWPFGANLDIKTSLCS